MCIYLSLFFAPLGSRGQTAVGFLASTQSNRSARGGWNTSLRENSTSTLPERLQNQIAKFPKHTSLKLKTFLSSSNCGTKELEVRELRRTDEQNSRRHQIRSGTREKGSRGGSPTVSVKSFHASDHRSEQRRQKKGEVLEKLGDISWGQM